jgi:GntR family transcriptional regulator
LPLDLGSLRVDRGSPIPLYFQIERMIQSSIESGLVTVAEQLPNEPDLAERFGVSRSVIRQALSCLEQSGLLTRVRGQGTFVTARQQHSWHLQSSEGFFENEGRRGRTVASRVLRARVEPLPSWAAMLLGASEGASGVVLERLRWVDGLLTIYDLNYLPPELEEGVVTLRDDPGGSLYDVLRLRYGLAVSGGHRLIDAVLATDGIAALLEVDAYSPLLRVEAVDLDATNSPFDCYRTWVRPDRLRLEVEVTDPIHSRRRARPTPEDYMGSARARIDELV